MTTLEPFFRVFDLLGVFVFAISGSIAAARKNMDVYGSVILAVVTALGGGMIRDSLLGRTPAGAFVDPLYLLVALAGAVSVFFLYNLLGKLHYPMRYMDAVGLGVFTVTGMIIALDQDVFWFGAVMLGVISGTGGGMIRDVLCQQVPLVLEREIYAVAGILGALLTLVMLRLGLGASLSAAIGALVISSIRILSVQRDWHLPRAVWQKPGSRKI